MEDHAPEDGMLATPMTTHCLTSGPARQFGVMMKHLLLSGTILLSIAGPAWSQEEAETATEDQDFICVGCCPEYGERYYRECLEFAYNEDEIITVGYILDRDSRSGLSSPVTVISDVTLDNRNQSYVCLLYTSPSPRDA